MYSKKSQVKGCCPKFEELVEIIIEDEMFDVPTTADEACQLYVTLLYLIDDFCNILYWFEKFDVQLKSWNFLLF